MILFFLETLVSKTFSPESIQILVQLMVPALTGYTKRSMLLWMQVLLYSFIVSPPLSFP